MFSYCFVMQYIKFISSFFSKFLNRSHWEIELSTISYNMSFIAVLHEVIYQTYFLTAIG